VDPVLSLRGSRDPDLIELAGAAEVKEGGPNVTLSDGSDQVLVFVIVLLTSVAVS